MPVAKNYLRLKKEIASLSPSTNLLVVSKNHPYANIAPIYEAGCRDFGENRVQELLEKMEGAPADIRWHFIGTLQKNKVAKIVGKVALIHSVDTPDLAAKINACSAKQNICAKVLLQVNTSNEPAKHGLTTDGWEKVIEPVLNLSNLSVQGFMTMAANTSDEAQVRASFAALAAFKQKMETRFDRVFPHLSMGMSGDYHLAISEGATMVRLGSLIFQ